MTIYEIFANECWQQFHQAYQVLTVIPLWVQAKGLILWNCHL